MNALRPRGRPDYRTARATSRHHRCCSSVRSPAGVARRLHGGRPAARHPHCAGLLRCRCGRPAAFFTSPVWQPQRLPRARPRAHTRGACMRTPYRLRNRPATRRCGKILKSARVAGLACVASRLRLVAAARIRTGTVTAARLPQRHSVGQRTGRRVAGSLRAGCARRRISCPQCGSRRHTCRAPAATPGAGGGSRAGGARSLRVDTRPSPHARRSLGRRHSAPRPASMYAAAPVKRGGPRSRIRTPTRHERASPHPSRKCR